MAKKGPEEFRRAILSGEIKLPANNNQESISVGSNPKGADAFREAIKTGQIDVNSMIGSTKHLMEKQDPLNPTGFEDEYSPEVKEYEQPIWQDFLAGVYNGLIVEGGKGLANLIPTVAQAAGSDLEIFESWKSNVTDWFKEQEVVLSDKAYQPIEGFSDITTEHVSSGLGQGIGFILGILGGGGAIGSVGKGASTLSKVSSATKLMNATEKAAYLAKNADMISKAQKGAKISARIGSFVSGTTLMYPAIEEEAKKAGLSNIDASRFALGVSGLVSMTEGAALEWVGKIATKPLSSSLTKKAISETLKNAKTKNPVQLQKLFLENFSKKLGSNIDKIVKSSAVEFGQEFGQTYIEEGAKQLWDVVMPEEKGKFGADVSTYKQFVEATYSGIMGAIIGGGLAGTHIASKKITGQVDSDEDNNLLNQSLFGYINTSIQNGKTKNIENLDLEIQKQVDNGSLTKDEAIVARENIASLTEFATDYNTTHVKDNTALYQLFQLDSAKKSMDKFSESLVTSENANEAVKKVIEEKKGKIELVKNRIQENFNQIFNNGKPETKNKEKFDEKLVKYNSVLKDISDNNIDEETINKKLDSIFNPYLSKEKDKVKEAKKSEPKYGKTYSPKEDIILTDKVLNDKAGFTNMFNEAVELEGDERQAKIKEIEDTYGINKDAANWLSENIEFEPSAETEVQENKEETTPEEVIEDTPKEKTYKLQKEIKDTYGVDVVFNDDNTFEQPTTDIKGFGGTQAINDAIKVLEEKGFKKKVEETEKKPTSTKEQQPTKEVNKDTVKKVDSSEKEVNQGLDIDKQDEQVTDKEDGIVDDEVEEVDKQESDEVKETDKKLKQEEPLVKKTDENLNKENEAEEIKETSYSELTDSEIQSELETNDALTSEQREQLIAEQSKRAAKKQDVENQITQSFLTGGGLDSILDGLEQRSPYEVANEKLLVRNNPELYQKIKEHFAKIFPHIPVHEIDNLGEKYGAKILARVVERGIEINPNEAIQTSLIHEYTHIFLEILGDNHPLVQLGYQAIEGSRFDKDAQALYPDKSRKEQLNEALTEALATNALEKLQTKLEGSNLDKFLAFAKRFWKRIKRYFTGAKLDNVNDILSDALVFNNKPHKVNLSSLIGMNKNQLNRSTDKKFIKTRDLVQRIFTRLKLNSIEKGVEFKQRSESFVSKNIMAALYKLYLSEKSGNKEIETKLFDGVEIDNVKELNGLSFEESIEYINNFDEQLKSKDKTLYDNVKKLTKELFRVNLNVSSITEEDFDEDTENQDSNNDDNAVKASKKINNSVQSLLSSLLDDNGKIINPDVVFSYITRVSENTYGIKGLYEKLEKDASKPNGIIANAILSISKGLSEGQKAGFDQVISSLISEQSEALNLNYELDEDGKPTKFSFRNPIVNKDDNIGDTRRNFEKARNIKGFVDYFNGNEVAINPRIFIDKDPLDLDYLAHYLGQLFGVQLEVSDIINLIENTTPTKRSDGSYNTKEQTLYNTIFGQFESIKTFLNKKQDRNDEAVEWKNITGYVEKIHNQFSQQSLLQRNYLNGRGNAESSIKLGHWASDLISMLKNDNVTGRMTEMLQSPIYKNNSVLKYFKDKRINWAKLDSVKNLVKDEVVDYSMINANDYQILQAAKYFSNTGDGFYKQSIGVISNRDGMLLFEVPKYSLSELRKEYVKQRDYLQDLLNKQMEGLDASQKKKLIKDFNNLYIYKADNSGKVSIPNDEFISKEVNKIADVLKKNGMYDALNIKDSTLKEYFLTEALNRVYLSDIFSGPALYHSNPNSGKGAVEGFVKRMSGLNSNGNNIEIKNPVTVVIFDGKKSGVTFSDSFGMYSKNLNKEITDFTGSFSPVGINAKNNIFQIDPVTGKNLYIKSSNVNSTGENLKGLGDVYGRIENALNKIEEHLGENANVMIIDKSAMKGTYEYSKDDVLDLDVLIEASEKGTIDAIANKFHTVKINSMKSPFNLNKKLKELDKQTAIFSTQAMLVQFNNDFSKINKFEQVAVKYLLNKMGGKTPMESKAVQWLLNTDNTIDDMLSGMGNREKSVTTEILLAVREYNKNNPDNKIKSFDHPSLRLIYEQHVASALGKSGIKIDMPGNFLHQLPNLENDLEHNEVAVPWAMFANSLEEANELLRVTRENGSELKVAVVRIPASAEVSMFAGKVKRFLDTDANVVQLSNGFVRTSGSDHDGDKAMVYRQEIGNDGVVKPFSLMSQMFNQFYNNLSSEAFVNRSVNNDLEFDVLKEWVNQEVSEVIEEVKEKKEISEDVFQYFGKQYKVKLENGKPISVNVGNSKSERNIINAYLSNPNIDPQNGKPFRKVEDKKIEDNIKPKKELILNKEQQEAVNKTIDFIDNGNPNEFFVIEGKAGTGKTTIAEKIVEKYIHNKDIIVAALSHKARGVIQSKVAPISKHIKFETIASMLALKMDVETGTFIKPKNSDFDDVPIKESDIIIIDEASMINEEMIQLIFENKKPNAKVIFLGDIGQLPPIRTNDNPYFVNKRELFEKKSPVFSGKNKTKLLTRVRQGEESPILPYADNFWENSQKLMPKENPVITKKENKITENGSLIFVNTFNSIKEKVLESFRKGIETNNPNHIKVVTYKNDKRKLINNYIHQSLFGKDAPELNKGELIILNSSKEIDELLLTNSEEYSVVDNYTSIDEDGIEINNVTVDYNGDGLLIEIPTVSFKDKQKFNKLVQNEFDEAIRQKKAGNSNYKKQFVKAYKLKDKYIEIDYAYAITSHKSQGSTYDIVIVDEADIMSVKPISNKTKSEAIYTGLTRAKDVSIVISDSQVNEIDFDLESLVRTPIEKETPQQETVREIPTEQTQTSDREDTQKTQGKKETTYKSGSINNIVDIAQKMGFGGQAVGRFAIASKLMSLLSSYNAEIKPDARFNFKGKAITNFTNENLDDIALLLQAALDIGNDPILTETGFTETTIDIGNAMILSGVKGIDVVNFLKSDAIQKLSRDFQSKNSVFNTKNKIDFKSYLRGLEYQGADVANDDVADFLKFNNIANDLSKLINFIQLDKSLPNNAQLTDSILNSIDDFKELSFDTSGLMNRELYKHRLKVLTAQQSVYESTLLSSNPEVKKIVSSLGKQVNNSFELDKKYQGQIEQYLSQKFLKKKRDNVSDFIYSFPNKMETIYNRIVLDKETSFEFESRADIQALYEIGLVSHEGFNAMMENYKDLDTDLVMKELNEYSSMVSLSEKADIFRGNSFFDFLTFREVDGKKIMGIKKEFKATDETLSKFREDFKKIQELDPDLANDIIDYQLYRHGLNNKIGSYIEGLPMDINVQSLLLGSKIINTPSRLDAVKKEIKVNLMAANKDMLINFTSIDTLNKYKGDKKLAVVNDVIYTKVKNKNGIDQWTKSNIGKFEADNNFTAFNTEVVKTISQSEINETKNSCK